MTSIVPRRPILRYHGGKWMLAPWIIQHFPTHRIYCEPFAGAGSVLMRKPRSAAEIVNDLDDEIVNVFRVLRDPELARELARVCELTPYSRREFLDSYGPPTADPVERARRRVVRAAMAFGTTSGKSNRTGFRATPWRGSGKASCGRSNGVKDWSSWPQTIASFTNRLQGVCIDSRPALEVIAQQDAPYTCFYCDPPYPHSTRTAIRSPSDRERAYANDMTDDEHRELAAALRRAKGFVVLSGYPCELYDVELYPDWRRVEKVTLADGARSRTEVLWINPATSAALEGRFAFA